MATPYCTTKPRPGSYMGAPCDACGHALALHIGVEHCPVCEMTDLNAQTWHEKLLSGQKSINDHRRAVGMPPPDTEPEPDAPPTTVSIYAQGGVLTERQVSDMVERVMLRAGMRVPTSYSPYRRL